MKFLKIIKIHNFHPRFILSIVKSIIFLKNIKKNLLPRNAGYGSVGHELPLLNFKVINAGFNPHYNYSFNLHPKDIKKYGLILSKLEKQKNKINRKEIYEFFYTHYTLNRSDDFLFDSYEKYCRYVKYKMKNENCYKYFLKNDKIYLRKYRRNIYDSIISNRCFSVEKILKKEKQIKLKKTDLSKFIKYEII